MNKRTPSFIR